MTTKGIEITLPTGTLKSRTKELLIVPTIECDVCRWDERGTAYHYVHYDMWLCREHAQEHGLIW